MHCHNNFSSMNQTAYADNWDGSNYQATRLGHHRKCQEGDDDVLNDALDRRGGHSERSGGTPNVDGSDPGLVPHLEPVKNFFLEVQSLSRSISLSLSLAPPLSLSLFLCSLPLSALSLSLYTPLHLCLSLMFSLGSTASRSGTQRGKQVLTELHHPPREGEPPRSECSSQKFNPVC